MSAVVHAPPIPAAMRRDFIAAGHAHHIPPAVLAAVAWQESGFGRNKGPSSAGARGTMQFMPGTAAGLGINPMDDRQAIFGAARLLNAYGYQDDAHHALAAYNAGPGNTPAGEGYARDVERKASVLGAHLSSGAVASGAGGHGGPAPDASTPEGGGFMAGLMAAGLKMVLIGAGAFLAFAGVRTALQPAR